MGEDMVVRQIRDDEFRAKTQRDRILRAQHRAQRFLKHGDSLVEELLRERRDAAKSEFRRTKLRPEQPRAAKPSRATQFERH